ncbi:hypothetical protein FACS1894113_3590 [Alphaproteobacteria bacterium]|nr:hypothetical protein FACS1894113_3590 [Alphaproteobacteria bacterium]
MKRNFLSKVLLSVVSICSLNQAKSDGEQPNKANGLISEIVHDLGKYKSYAECLGDKAEFVYIPYSALKNFDYERSLLCYGMACNKGYKIGQLFWFVLVSECSPSKELNGIRQYSYFQCVKKAAILANKDPKVENARLKYQLKGNFSALNVDPCAKYATLVNIEKCVSRSSFK